MLREEHPHLAVLLLVQRVGVRAERRIERVERRAHDLEDRLRDALEQRRARARRLGAPRCAEGQLREQVSSRTSVIGTSLTASSICRWPPRREALRATAAAAREESRSRWTCAKLERRRLARLPIREGIGGGELSGGRRDDRLEARRELRGSRLEQQAEQVRRSGLQPRAHDPLAVGEVVLRGAVPPERVAQDGLAAALLRVVDGSRWTAGQKVAGPPRRGRSPHRAR